MVQLTRVGLRPGIGGGAQGGGASGIRYYVSASGSDSNNGMSTGSPWQTISKVNASTFSPGDIVSFRGGDTFTGPLTIPSSGAASAPLTFTSYGTGQATITAPAGSNGIESTDQTYLTIDGLTVTGAGAASNSATACINLFATNVICTNLTVQNCNVSGGPQMGIAIRAGSSANCALVNPRIYNCVANGNALGWGSTAGVGIRISGGRGAQNTGSNYNCTGAYIGYCTANDNSGKLGAAGPNGSGIFLGAVNGFLVEHCLADNNGANCNDPTSGPGAIWGNSVANGIWQYNVASNTKTAGADGVGFDMDGGVNDCIMQFNISYKNASYGFMNYQYDGANFSGNVNNVFRYNISYDDLQGGLRLVSGGTTGVNGQVYGNTFHTVTSGSPLKLEKNGGSMAYVIANNNFTSAKSGTTDLVLTSGNPGGCTLAGNNYYTPNTWRITWNSSTYATLALFRAGTSQETTGGSSGAVVAPLYLGYAPYLYSTQVSNRCPYNAEPWHPDEASPVFSAGVNLSTNFSINNGGLDFFGSPVTAGNTDIGHGSLKSAYKTVVLSGSGNQTIPADFAQFGWVDCIGAGGSNSTNQAGAGGGAFSRITSTTTTLTAGVTTIPYTCGAASAGANGGDSWWNASSLANAQSLGSSVACAAEGGKTNSTTTGGTGGSSANSVGTVKWSGGTGGNTVTNSGGGGGSGGPNGAGGNATPGTSLAGGGGGGANGGRNAFSVSGNVGGQGGTGPFNDNGGAGGNVTNGTSGTRGAGGGGAGNSGGNGGAGGAGVDWRDSTSGTFYGSGGGAGANIGGGGSAVNVGGAFGGGAGGRMNALGGAGGIRFVYKTSASV